jgi:hypothetical protein
MWVAMKRWGQKKWCNIGRQTCCEFSVTSNECRTSNQRFIKEKCLMDFQLQSLCGQEISISHNTRHQPRRRQQTMTHSVKIQFSQLYWTKKSHKILFFIIVTCYIRVFQKPLDYCLRFHSFASFCHNRQSVAK